MLPPDNFQEDPAPVLAHRTSPTNIGLYLLSIVSARDFGWIGTVEAVERLEATLADHERPRALPRPFLQLVRHAGSAAARSAVRLLGRQRQPGRAPDRARQCVPRMAQSARSTMRTRLAGIADALDLTREEAGRLRDGRRTQTVTWHQLDDALAVLVAGRATGARRRRRHRGTARGACRPGRDHGRHRPRARDRAGRRYRRRHAVLGGGGPRDAIESHRRDLDHSADRPRSLAARLAALEETARATALEMEFGFLLDRDRKLLSIGYLVSGGHARSELLRSARLRGAARELHRDRQGRRSGAALVSPRPRRDAGRARRRADLVVGIDVRVPDAVARHARAGRQPDRADEPPDRAPPDRLRGDARRPVGRSRNPPTTPAISSSPTSIRTSAFPASA